MVALPKRELLADPLANGTIIDLRPLQGLWTQTQYIRLSEHTMQLLEFTDGRLEALPMPTRLHQAICLLLGSELLHVMHERGGIVLCAPLRLRIREGKFREPDLLLLLDANDPRNQDDYWRGADLVMEVVSPDDPKRDTCDKRLDYAEAHIPEYWIVNPPDDTITVLTLEGGSYAKETVYRRGQRAASALLDGFTVDVTEVFNAATPAPR